MASGNESSTFQVNLAGNASVEAIKAANSLQSLRDAASAGTKSISDMSAQLRTLKAGGAGTGASAKLLTAQMKEQKQAIALATLKTIEHKKALDAMNPIARKFTESFSEAKDKIREFSVGESLAGLATKLAAGAVTLAVTATLALTAALVAGSVAFGAWIIHAADGARSARLLRDAAMGGNAQWGQNFGDQVEALGRKVPQSRAELDKLGKSLAAQRIGGQIWVDTINAVAQASAALGDSAGSKLEEFVTRGRLLQRFRLNPQELLGTGVDFKEVATALAGALHTGVDAAQKALFEGRVKLSDGAAALRAAVEKKFGAINLRQLISLDVLAKKFGETLDDITKGVNLEPLLTSLKEIADMFSLSSVTGNALKQIVSVFGNDLVGSFKSGTPLMKRFIYGAIMGAQDLTIAYLRVRNAIRDALPKGAALDAIKVGFYALGVAAVVAGVSVAFAVAPILAAGAAFAALPLAITAAIVSVGLAVNAFMGTDWEYLGRNIIDGIKSGLDAGWTSLKNAVKGLATSIKDEFKLHLGIHSPSKVFAEFGENTTAGFQQGIEAGSGDAQASVNAMVAPPSQSSSGGAKGQISVKVEVNIFASGGGDVGAQVASPSVIDQLTQAVFDALQSAGIPVPS